MHRAKRCLGYCRVSTVEQSVGTSLEDQQRLIRAYARESGLNVARVYTEAESGVFEREERREQVAALLADVKAGDLVLCDKVDRWSRDPAFTYTTIRQILRAGAQWYAIGDDCDPSTAEGDTMLNVRVLIAREEHKRIKQRLLGTRQRMRDRGLYADGGVPLGYRRGVEKGPARHKLIVEPGEAAVVRDIFRRCIGGESSREIGEQLGLPHQSVKAILHRRTYLGEVRSSTGEWVRDTHGPIVDAATFAAAQAALADRFRGRERSGRGSEIGDLAWLRGLAVCACGARRLLRVGNPRPRAPWGRHAYYVCAKRCGAGHVNVYNVEQQAEQIVLQQLDALRELLACPPNVVRHARPAVDLEAARRRLDARRERELDLFTGGDITRDELRVRLGRLDDERTKLDARANVLQLPDAVERRAALRRIDAVTHSWQRVTPAERRALVESLARCVYLARGEEPRFDWYAPEDIARRG